MPTDQSDSTIAEDLVMVLLNPDKGAIRANSSLTFPLAGAVLSQLALDGHVEVEDLGAWKGHMVSAVGPGPDDPLLRQAWLHLEPKPLSAQRFLSKVGSGLRGRVLDRLVERGHIVRSREKVLGIFPRTVLADGGTGRRAEVLEPVRAALADGIQPEPRTAVIAALLSAGNALHSLRDDIPWTKEVRQRAKAFQDGDWGAQAASRALAAATAAVSAATAASVAASS